MRTFTAVHLPPWFIAAARPLIRRIAALPGLRPCLRTIRRRHGGPAWLYRSIPVEGRISVRLPDGTTVQYLATARDFIGRDLYWFGWKGFEPETTRLFLHLARAARVVVDVGANTGIYTLMAGRTNPRCRIMAVEPVDRVRTLLEMNIALNGLESRCTVVAGAVSRTAGTVRFHVPDVPVPSSASLHVAGFRGCAGDLVEVPAHTLDDLCAQFEKVDLLKIDVEGFEDEVLEGASRLLAQSRPFIIVECNPDGPHGSVQALLEPHGYRFFRITDQECIAMKTIAPDPTERFRNVLCLPDGLRPPPLSRLDDGDGRRIGDP